MNEGFFGSGSRHPYFEIGDEKRAAERVEHDKWIEHVGRTTGTRWITGKSDGLGWIIFRPDGSVDVWWNRYAALASSHATGNRKAKIIRPGAKGMPPELDPLFNAVAVCRRYQKSEGTTCPESPTDPAAASFRRIFKRLSWKMLQAVGNGDFDTLRTIADHLENFEKLQDGALPVGESHWQDIANAIQRAAIMAGGVPRRSQVYEAYTKDSKTPEKNSLNEPLVRMGFGWLPSPLGKPPKVRRSTGE